MKKFLILLFMLFTLTALTSCEENLKLEDMTEAIDQYAGLSYYMTSEYGGDYDNILLPHTMIIDGGVFDEFSVDEYKDNSIKITWEIISENLSFETLSKQTVNSKVLKTECLLNGRIYGELKYYDDNDEANTIKVDYTKNLTSAKLKATFTCHELVYTKEFEITNLVSHKVKFLTDKNYDYNSSSNSWEGESGTTLIYEKFKYKTYSYKINFDDQKVTLTYNRLANGRTREYYNYIYDGSNQTITIETILYKNTFEINNYGEPFEVFNYQLEYYQTGYTKFIEILEFYNEVQILFNNRENLTPFYGSGYPSLSTFIVGGR